MFELIVILGIVLLFALSRRGKFSEIQKHDAMRQAIRNVQQDDLSSLH